MSALTTFQVCASVSPSIVSTCVGHFLNRKNRKQKPTAHLRYELGLRIVRSFIETAGKHPVEAIQSFTSAYVPVAPWVSVDQVTIPNRLSQLAAEILCHHLGQKGIEEVGGSKWWQWRKNDDDLKADWIEMQKDKAARGPEKSNRILLYLHGGAYYFGSTDEHRYQIQRHARKLKARAFAPRYRLAPQFPFPCGLFDCLAAYLFLLEEYDPDCILISGDSAGGGMTAALLVILRDQGIPLPAGAMLLSPWLDLTHSFPSIMGDGQLDYIPIHGFVHRPSLSWPPAELQTVPNPDREKGGTSERLIRPDWIPAHVPDNRIMPTVELEGKEISIKSQIQLYAQNFQLLNPLVSPVNNPSLGGLCPLLIQVGGGELISDEQVYFAHKAANPTAFPPSDEIMDRYDPNREILHKYPPTNVQLQVWNDVCHVPHTLAWTKPAKYMYRSVAQFGAWALARAQHVAIDIDDAEDISGSDKDSAASKSINGDRDRSRGQYTSTETDTDNITPSPSIPVIRRTVTAKSSRPALRHHHSNPMLLDCNQIDNVGRAGDPLPPFDDHMIRQRIDRHGNVYPLGPPELFFSLKLRPHEVGVIKEAPVRRWRERQEKWRHLFAKYEPKVNAKRTELERYGLPDGMEGEKPPPTALIRRWRGEQLKKRGKPEEKQQEVAGLKWWSGWASKQDREEIKHHIPAGQGQAEESAIPVPSGRQSFQSHRRRRSSIVVDQGQADIGAISSRRGSHAGGPVQSHAAHLQVPVIDSTGHRISSSTASIKSGTVGKGPDIPARESSKPTPAVVGVSPEHSTNDSQPPTNQSHSFEPTRPAPLPPNVQHTQDQGHHFEPTRSPPPPPSGQHTGHQIHSFAPTRSPPPPPNGQHMQTGEESKPTKDTKPSTDGIYPTAESMMTSGPFVR